MEVQQPLVYCPQRPLRVWNGYPLSGPYHSHVQLMKNGMTARLRQPMARPFSSHCCQGSPLGHLWKVYPTQWLSKESMDIRKYCTYEVCEITGKGRGNSSVAHHLPGKHKVLSLILCTKKKIITWDKGNKEASESYFATELSDIERTRLRWAQWDIPVILVLSKAKGRRRSQVPVPCGRL